MPGGKRLPAHWLSYARRVPIPAEFAGHTIFLHLDNVRYHVTLSVNGREIEHYVGGLEPHRLDITAAVTPGEDALLLLTIGDIGVSGHRPFDPFNYTGTRLPTCKEIENNHVHPVRYGGSDGRQVEHVTLEAVPPVRAEYVFANPSIAQGVLRYRVALVNDTDAVVYAHCRSEAVGAKVLVDEPVSIPARGAITLERESPGRTLSPGKPGPRISMTCAPRWRPTDKRWTSTRTISASANSPSMVTASISTARKSTCTAIPGTSERHRMLCRLRRRCATWLILKERCHLNHIRLHAAPQDPRWVEAADRVGMLITTETALWTTGFSSFDWLGSEEACYENVRNHFLQALVRRDRNRPSVIIWSLSNEMSPITPVRYGAPENGRHDARLRAHHRRDDRGRR